MDYAALAKQYGGTSTPQIDYAGLAAQFGAVEPLAARVAKIPGGAMQAPAAKPERSALDVIGGVLETPLALASGAVGGLVRPVATMVGELSSPYPQGSPQATAAGQRAMQAASRGLYTPQTQTGQEIMGNMSEALGFLPPMQPMGTLTATANALAAPAMRQATDATSQVAQRSTAPIRNALTRSNQQMSGMGAANTAEELLRAERLQRLDIPSTVGERTKNLPQQQFESQAERGSLGGISEGASKDIQESMANFRGTQKQAIANNFARMSDEIGAETTEASKVGEIVDAALNAEYTKKFNDYKAKYKLADESGETLQPVSYQPLLDFINAKTPTFRKTLDPILDSVAESLAMNDPSKTGQITVRALEDIYQQIGKVKNSPSARDLKNIITQIGDDAGGQLYQQARTARSNLARQFEDVQKVDALLSTKTGYADRKVALDKVFDYVVLKGPLEEMRTVTTLLKKGGAKGQQAMAELRGQTIQYLEDSLIKGDQMSVASFTKIVNQLDKERKLEYLFGKKGRDHILDLRDGIRDVLVKEPGAVNFSGSGSAVIQGLRATLRAIPGVGFPIKMGEGLYAKSQVSKALKQPTNQLAPSAQPTNNLAP
jgi:hypothetical protein